MPGLRSGWYASLLIGLSCAASAWAQAPAAEPAAPATEPQPIPALPTTPVAPPATAPSAQPATPAAPLAPPAGAAPAAAPPATALPEEEPKAPPPEPPPVAKPEPASTKVSVEAKAALDEEPSEPSDREDQKEKLPWNASIDWSQAYVADGISRGGEPSFNPTYAWDFMVTLGYRLDPLTALSLRQPLSVELTDSDTTNTRQELWLLDTTLDLNRKLWKTEPAKGRKFELSGGIGVALPVSPSSQAAHVIVGGRAKVGFEYSEKQVWHGLSAGTGLSYVHRFATSNVVHTDTSFACITGDPDVSHGCSYLGGSTTTRDVLKLDLHGELRPLDPLAISASFGLAFIRAHGLADYDMDVLSGGTVHLEDTSKTHFRNSREIIIGVGYDFTDWFSAQLYTANTFPERSGTAKLRAPFHTVDTAFGLTLALLIDQLYLAQRGGG